MRVVTRACSPQDLEVRLRAALDDKNRFKIEADRARDELGEKRRQCDTLEQVSDIRRREGHVGRRWRWTCYSGRC